MKKCNFCWKEIKDTAIKCRYCWRFLNINETIKYEKNKKYYNNKNTSRFNEIIIYSLIIISIFSILCIVFLFNFFLKESEFEVTLKEKQNTIKSIVKIKYTPNIEIKDEYIKWSWILFSKDGLVLTNSHIINDETKWTSNWEIDICILDSIGYKPKCDYKGSVLIRNPKLDLAVLKISNYNSNNYIKLFWKKSVNINDFSKSIQIYWYPSIWWETITITTWIIAWFDKYSNIKTDAEINLWNSWWGAFLWSRFIWVPSMISYDKVNYWKLWNIISDRIIFNRFNSILINWKKEDFSYLDFIPSNLKLKNDNTINWKTKNYISSSEKCINEYWEYTYYNEYTNECICFEWFELWKNNTCTLSSDTINAMFELWTKNCLETYWNNSRFIYDPLKEEFVCDCIEWYEIWWKDNNKCIIELTEEGKWNNACKKYFWEKWYYTWKKEWNKYICSCEEWYKFSENNSKCILE